MLSLSRPSYHPWILLRYITTTWLMFKFSSGPWRYQAGLHSNPMPETPIMDIYPWYPIQAPQVHDTPFIHSPVCHYSHIQHFSSSSSSLKSILPLHPSYLPSPSSLHPPQAHILPTWLHHHCQCPLACCHLVTVVHSRTIGKNPGFGVLQLGVALWIFQD